MRSRLFLPLLLLLILNQAQAAYFTNIPRIVIQPNRDTLHCFASGDEFHHWLHDNNGYTIVQNPATGYYVYANLVNTKLQPTAYVAGKVNPASVGLTPELNISPKQWMEKRKLMEDEMLIGKNSFKSDGVNRNRGVMNNLVIFIRFADDSEFNSTYSFVNQMLNDTTSEANSMYSYFKSASYNQLQIFSTFYPAPNGDVILSYQDSHPRSYYETYSAFNPDGYQDHSERKDREHDLLINAVNAVSASVPQSLNIDYDNDGRVDNVCFIVKGNASDWSDLLWPHRWTLSSGEVFIGDTYVWDYNFQLEDPARFNNSTMCHEMFHTLSAPDLYHYNSAFQSLSSVGPWDLMERNAPTPQHSGGYVKHLYGNWIDSIPQITTYGTYTLFPISSPSPEKVCYKIASENPDEYFVLEYRRKSRPYESELPGSGILIYRINDAFRGNGNADYNGYDILDEVYLYRPNGAINVNGNLSTAAFSSNQNRLAFHQLTNPHPFFSDGSISNLVITNITSTSDSIQFTYGTPFLSVNTDTIRMRNSIGDTNHFEINTNIYWHISEMPSWLNVLDTAGVNNSTVTLAIAEKNEEIEPRSCVLEITANGLPSKNVVVLQPGNIGMKPVQIEKRIAIYPNPANDVLNITFDSKGKSYFVNLVNSMGKSVLTKEISNDTGEFQLDVSGIKSGVYFLQLISEHNIASEKVIINN